MIINCVFAKPEEIKKALEKLVADKVRHVPLGLYGLVGDSKIKNFIFSCKHKGEWVWVWREGVDGFVDFTAAEYLKQNIL